MPEKPTYACPGCSRPVRYVDVRCQHCRASLLYGLITPPVSRGSVAERAAAIVAKTPGAPSHAESKRRLQSGAPLIVGLSREKAEHLQGQLVDLGLIPRLGPAPKGTVPLGAPSEPSGARRHVGLAALVPVLAIAVFWAIDRSSPEREAALAADLERGASPPAVTQRHELQVSATIERTRMGWMTLVGTVRALSSDSLPQGSLSLALRDARGLALWTGQLEPASAGGKSQRVRFSEFLGEIDVQGGTAATLEVRWGGWVARPTALTIPAQATP